MADKNLTEQDKEFLKWKDEGKCWFCGGEVVRETLGVPTCEMCSRQVARGFDRG